MERPGRRVHSGRMATIALPIDSPTAFRRAGLTLGAATVTTGLAGGTLFGFAVGVMPGLAHADDTTAVRTMQEINLHIVNPLFLSAFMGAVALSALATVMHWRL